MSNRIARSGAQAILHANPPPDGESLLPVLKALARAHALAVESDGSIHIIALKPNTSVSARVCGAPVAARTWQHVVERGWVVPHETLEGWRLSNAGRIALKRRLSATGAPAAAGPNASAAGGSSSSPPLRQRGAEGALPEQNDRESPLAWLRQRRDKQGRRFISDAQFSAGERLRRDFTFGNMAPKITSNWSPVCGGAERRAAPDRELELHDAQLRARERFRAALAGVGPEFSGVLVDVCCYLKGLEEVEQQSGWPRRTAKVVLRLGLSALARFYGLEAQHATGTREGPHSVPCCDPDTR